MIHDEHVIDAQLVYDSAADDYVSFVGTELSDKTEDAVDRSVLGAFVEFATSLQRRHPVADLGCGPGRVAAFLSRTGLETIGIDVSPELARLARHAHPDIPFAAGPISSLPLADHCLGGAVCWYSIIYTPPQHLSRTFGEIKRVVAPRGPVLLAFQAGPAEPIRRSDAFGSGHPPDNQLPARSRRRGSCPRSIGVLNPRDDREIGGARPRGHASGVRPRLQPTPRSSLTPRTHCPDKCDSGE